MQMNLMPTLFILMLFCFAACKQKQAATTAKSGQVEMLDPALLEILDTTSVVEELGSGFSWSEGPLWLQASHQLLFSDVPENKLYSWDSLHGVRPYLFPSGLDSLRPTGGIEGANGLALNRDGSLLLCQHGNRALASMLSPLDTPRDSFRFLATHYQGKRLNSPNDLQVARNGDIFFTDPPYGLVGQDSDKHKELAFNGVYRVTPAGDMLLIDSTLSRPNGIALSPDEKTLLVSNSDPERAIWVAYTLNERLEVLQRRTFADMTAMVDSRKGLPDGLKISRKGIIFASGPGGIHIFHPDGRHLGTVLTYEATANCALDASEKWLYMTADGFLKRIKLK